MTTVQSTDEYRRGAYLLAVFADRRDPRTGELLVERVVRAHLDALQDYAAGRFADVLMVVNTDFPERTAVAFRRMAAAWPPSPDVPWRFHIRRNGGYSYGAFRSGLDALATNDPAIDHVFLMEDDYVPAQPGFADAFAAALADDPRVGYVAQLAHAVPGTFPYSAAVANGVVSMRAVRDTIDLYGTSLSLFPFEMSREDYGLACENQVTFLALMESAGYWLTDLSATQSVLFYEATTDELLERGTPGGSQPIQPVQVRGLPTVDPTVFKDTEHTSTAAQWQAAFREAQSHDAGAAVARSAVAEIARERDDAVLERDALLSERAVLAARLNDHTAVTAHRDRLETDLAEAAELIDNMNRERAVLLAEREELLGAIAGMTASRSWRYTTLLRKVTGD